VVALIVPWNFPLPIAAWKVAPALAAGNTIVLKPAGLTPLTAIQLGRIALEAGLPEGVLNILVGAGRVVGERLVQHPDVAKVAFTGSTEVGKRIGALAAQQIKRVTLELGGKSANIVFADADLDRAAATAPLAVFGNAGQDCCARSRILVQRSALDPFMQALEKSIKSLRVGDPLDDRTEMGPLISADHRAGSGLLVPADSSISCREHGPRGARGDLRTDRRGDSFRRRERGNPDRERHDLRALWIHLDQQRRPGDACRTRVGNRDDLRQLPQLCARDDPVRRVQAIGHRARAWA
jgi:betaine-aldehyde dehydrogenase